MVQPFSSLLPGVDQRSYDSQSERAHSDRDTQVGLLDGGATSGGGTPLRTPLQDGLTGMPGTPLQVRLATLDSALLAGDGTPTMGTVRPSSQAALSRPPGSLAAQPKPLSQTGLASMGPAPPAGQRQPISQSGLASMAAAPQTGFDSMTSASPASLDISFASSMPVAQSGLASVAPALHSASPASTLPGSLVVQSSGAVPLSSAAIAVASTAPAAGHLLPQERATPKSMTTGLPASTVQSSSSPRLMVSETGLASLVAESGRNVAEFGSKVAEADQGAPPGKVDPFGVFGSPPSQVSLHEGAEVALLPQGKEDALPSQVSLGGYEAPSHASQLASSTVAMPPQGKEAALPSQVSLGGYEAPSPTSQLALSTVASLSPTLLGETTSFASKAPNPLGRMRRLMQDLEVQKLERYAATQQEAQLQRRLELLERIAGVHAGDIDGLENLAAWRMVPGTKQGFFVDADRVPDREANLLQKEQSKTMSVAFAELLAGRPTARGKALIREEAQHVFQEGEHAVEDVLKSLDHNMQVMTDD
eukprot:TRINITY_DN8791_c0_g1_i1.p1 TRINITY_DN8791_c0_g1~~TRINITY_DN8791_c0_g1_i1.p1  ORF type:complete len:533 (+),score=89.93 TRINITY_DN8791_c0_g1_i1:183-1781(+)